MTPKEMFDFVTSEKKNNSNWYVMNSTLQWIDALDKEYDMYYFSEDKAMYRLNTISSSVFIVVDSYDYFERTIKPLTYMRDKVNKFQIAVYNDEHFSLDKNLIYSEP